MGLGRWIITDYSMLLGALNLDFGVALLDNMVLSILSDFKLIVFQYRGLQHNQTNVHFTWNY